MKIAFLLMLFLPVLSCTTKKVNIYTDFDRQHNFSGYKTFSWTHENPMIVSNDGVFNWVIQKHIMEAIKSSILEQKYQFVENPEDADFAISFTVGARNHINIKTHPAIFHSDWRWGYNYYGEQVTTTQYTEGSLAIDVYDVKRRSPVWHGLAQGRIDKNNENDEAHIKQIVSIILSDFPN